MTKVWALIWWSRAGAELGTPWWVVELSADEQPKRCVEVRWTGGTTRTLSQDGGFTELPDGPRGVIELRAQELQLVYPAPPEIVTDKPS